MTVSLNRNWKIIELKEVDSTNDYAKKLIEMGYGEGFAVTAAKQTAGKGRRTRNWYSPIGNLYCSLIISSDCSTERMGQLSFVSAVAVIESIKHLAPAVNLSCKWPNDILVNGKKVTGILIENIIAENNSFAVVGIGINLKEFPILENAKIPATSLSAEGFEIEKKELLYTVINNFYNNLLLWRERGFLPIRHKWLANAFGLGSDIEIHMPNKKLCGRFGDIDENGAIVLINQSGDIEKIVSGEVFVINNSF